MFGLIAGGLSLLSGYKKSKAASKASNQSLGMQRDQLAFDQKKYNDAKAQYQPIEDKLLEMGMQNTTPDYEGVTDRAIGDVESQFAGGEAARIRQMQRMGVNPNSGRADAMDRNLSLSRSLARVGTINNANRIEKGRADNQTWDRTYNLNALGVNKMNNTANALSSSTNNMVNTYNNQANLNQQQASGLYSGAGSLIGTGLSALFGGS